MTADQRCASAERKARVARYELPGHRWYFAVCHDCQWVDLAWKDKAWAKDAVRRHNQARHLAADLAAEIAAWGNSGNLVIGGPTDA